MTRSAKRRRSAADRHGPLRSGIAAAGELIWRNPGAAGGVTAFTVAFLFVSANALWYQPHAHRSAFFETRERNAFPQARDEGESIIRIEREAAKADPAVEEVQRALTRLSLYAGTVDGIAGPRTKKAVEEYQRIVGLAITGEIDERLLARLRGGAYTTPALALPDPAPLPASYQSAENTASVKMSPPLPKPATAMPDIPATADLQIVRIQAGLRAFGNDGVEIDGVAGAQTKAAIREFQTLFGLPVTGEPDETLYAKMQEIGLTN